MGLAVGRNVTYDPTVTIWTIDEQVGKRIHAQGSASTKKADGTYENFSFNVFFIGDALNKIKQAYPSGMAEGRIRLDILRGDFSIVKLPRKDKDGNIITFKGRDGNDVQATNDYKILNIFEFNFHDGDGGNSNATKPNTSSSDSSFVNIPDSLGGSEDYLPFN